MLEPVVDGVWRIDLGQVNAYLVEVEAGPVLVDAGFPNSVHDIDAAVREAGYELSDLVGVLVTHTDLDHVGGLAEILETSGAPAYASEREIELLTGERKPPWLNTKGLFQRLTSPWLTRPPREPLTSVADGDTVHGFTVIETPGHAQGHLAFVDEVRDLAFVGDLVRTENRDPSLPPGVINYDSEQAAASVARLVEVAPDVQVACAGHGEPVVEHAGDALAKLGE